VADPDAEAVPAEMAANAMPAATVLILGFMNLSSLKPPFWQRTDESSCKKVKKLATKSRQVAHFVEYTCKFWPLH
jgi:hypothetical protein